MKLTRLEVQDFKRITAIDITLGDHLTEISGKNGAGKSSTLDAPWTLLRGLDAAPTVPIHDGAERALIRGTFRGADVALVVTRTFAKADNERGWTSKLEIATPEGLYSKTPPQQQLNAIIGEHRLDPIEFISLDAKEQVDAFRPFLPDVDFEGVEAENEREFQLRRDIGRVFEQQKAAAEAIQVPPTLPAEEIDVSALTRELEEVGAFNEQLERRRSNRDNLRAEIARRRNSATDLRDQAQELIEKADALEASANADEERLNKAEVLPERKDSADIRAKIDEAQKVNAMVLRAAERARHLDAARESEAKYDALTQSMRKRTEDLEAKIRGAKLPLPNIGFTQSGLTLNGLPFEQASTAEKLRTAVALSMALHPKLRLMWIRDASLLDDDTLASVKALAEEYDCQVLLETVRPQTGAAIVMEDGHVAGVPEPAREEAPKARKKKATESTAETVAAPSVSETPAGSVREPPTAPRPAPPPTRQRPALPREVPGEDEL